MPERRRFTIRFGESDVHGGLPPCSIEVALYDTTEEVQAAVRKSGVPVRIAREVGGAFTYKTHRLPYRGHLGVMRLSLDTGPHLLGVIIHESMHAAVRAAKWHYGVAELRLNEAKSAEREEVVAWYTGLFAEEIASEVL